MKDFTERVVVSAIDQDGLNVNAYSFDFLTKKGVDIKKAVRDAARDYCKTEEGLRVYIGNCHCFNWGDFDIYVDNDFCKPYGFVKVSSTCQIDVNFNEELVSETDVLPEYSE